MEKQLEKLNQIGFKKVGEWALSMSNKERIVFNIDENLHKQDLLYAFESDGQVYYIGRTEKSLKERMNNYKAGKNNGAAGSTNKLVHKNIINLLNSGKKVNIFVLLDNANLEYCGIKISLASGLEMNLIKAQLFENLWNLRGGSIKKVVIKNKKTQMNENKIVKLKLGKEYYNKGIISFSKKHADFLPKTSGIKVKLIIKQDNIIFPTYTISGEKRIINGNNDLNEWFQRNHQLNDTIRIEIISETEFRICD
jgi:hypothetical protein